MKEVYLKWMLISNQIDIMTFMMLKKKFKKSQTYIDCDSVKELSLDELFKKHLKDNGFDFEAESKKVRSIHNAIDLNEYSDFNIHSTMFASKSDLRTSEYYEVFNNIIKPYLLNVYKMFKVTGNAFSDSQRSCSINDIERMSSKYFLGTNITAIVGRLNKLMEVIKAFLDNHFGKSFDCPEIYSIRFMLLNKSGIINFMSWD